MLTWRRLLAIVLLLNTTLSFATRIAGTPPLVTFTPDLENLYPQTYAVEVGPDGTIYVGSADGVLAFDGDAWSLHQTPTADVVRILEHDGKDRLYAGGYDELGFFTIQPTGELSWTGLSAQARNLAGSALEDIWRVAIIEDAVYFSALRDQFRFDPLTGTLEHWAHDGRFGAIGEIHGETWLQFRGEGMRRYVDGEWEPVPNTDHLQDLIYFFWQERSGHYTGASQSGQWVGIDRPGVDADLTSSLGDAGAYASAVALDGGTVALGTRDGHVVVLSPERSVHRFRVSREWVSDLHRWSDGEHVVAVAGLDLIAFRWPPRWETIGEEHGLTGSVFGVVAFEEQSYVFGNTGVYRVTPAQTLENTGWTEAEAWDLIETDGRLLLADTYRLKLISQDGTVARPVTDDDVYPHTLQPSRFGEGFIWVIGAGLGIYTARDGYRSIDGMDSQIDSLVEISERDILVASSVGSPKRLTLAEDRTQVLSQHTFAEKLGESSLHRIDDSIFLTSEQGTYLFDGVDFLDHDLFGLESLRKPGELFSLELGPDRTLYAAADFRVLRRGSYDDWSALGLREASTGSVVSLSFPYDDGVPYFGVGQEIAVFRGQQHETVLSKAQGSRPVRLTSVVWRNGSEVKSFALDQAAPIEIEAGDWSIEYKFALMDLRAPNFVRYSERMIGHDAEFAPWDTATTVQYSQLTPGEYVFEVRGRNGEGEVSMANPFELTVTPLWFQTGWARTLAVLAVVMLSIATGRAIAKARASHLEKEIALRTKELEASKADIEQGNVKLRNLSEELAQQNFENEQLLRNVLPDVAIKELRTSGKVQPRYFPSATVVFTDIAGFTAATEKIPTDVVINALDEIFSSFDRAIGPYNLEKIKTIGDAYMCVAGIPEPGVSNVVDAILAAHAFRMEAKRCSRRLDLDWRIRVGIHSGPLIAGVVGTSKAAYDVWGSTVNLASRLESAGSTEHILVSESVRTQARDFFRLQHHATITTKENLTLDAYCVVGPISELVASGDDQKSEFAKRYTRYFHKPFPGFPEGPWVSTEPVALHPTGRKSRT